MSLTFVAYQCVCIYVPISQHPKLIFRSVCMLTPYRLDSNYSSVMILRKLKLQYASFKLENYKGPQLNFFITSWENNWTKSVKNSKFQSNQYHRFLNVGFVAFGDVDRLSEPLKNVFTNNQRWQDRPSPKRTFHGLQSQTEILHNFGPILLPHWCKICWTSGQTKT